MFAHSDISGATYSRPAQAIPAPDAEILRQMLEAELARLRCASAECWPVAASPEVFR